MINVNSNSWPATNKIPDFHSILSAHGYPDPTSGFKVRHDPHSAQAQQGIADGYDAERAGPGLLRVARQVGPTGPH